MMDVPGHENCFAFAYRVRHCMLFIALVHLVSAEISGYVIRHLFLPLSFQCV